MTWDVVIVGAGAAGLMCAIEAGKRGRTVLVIDHSTSVAEKIRISGGGRCNFTNIHCTPDKFISRNPHFCRSALSRYTPKDFIALIEKHGIPYHEKTLGQLFCDRSATDIIDMLLKECTEAGVEIKAGTSVNSISQDGIFSLETSMGAVSASSLVIATGGLSIPKIGATPFGYSVAEQFGLAMVPPRAGLVPLVFDPALLAQTKDLSGLSVDPSIVRSQNGQEFHEALLFTHRGLSGPAILQISSYWHQGEDITINLVPDIDALSWLKLQRQKQPRHMIQTVLADLLPKRLAQSIAEEFALTVHMADMPDKTLQTVANRLSSWTVRPSGSEGYRTAEVTLGGVDTDELSSKTFEAKKQPGLYFIGEVVDVTGHLGGFNFQWAWSSGWCAGQYV